MNKSICRHVDIKKYKDKFFNLNIYRVGKKSVYTKKKKKKRQNSWESKHKHVVNALTTDDYIFSLSTPYPLGE